MALTAGPAAARATGGNRSMRTATPDFGPNVLVFDPSMPISQIQADVDAVAAEQVSNQFGTQRYALLFEPGTYGSATQPLKFEVGYYTEVAGLGRSPRDVTINGYVDVHSQCFGPGGDTDCTALVNFCARCPTSRSTSRGRPAAGRGRISGPSRRRRRCVA
jgi:hypothetical protein